MTDTDIVALVERLRDRSKCPYRLCGESADALEAMQVEIERLRAVCDAKFIPAEKACTEMLERQRDDALEEAAQVVEGFDPHYSMPPERIAAAIRALAGDKP